jgi:hypothetical protein
MKRGMPQVPSPPAGSHVMTWHELGDDFYTSWQQHYDDYRAIETGLGISRRPISINE